jgi:hypothetical protein
MLNVRKRESRVIGSLLAVAASGVAFAQTAAPHFTARDADTAFTALRAEVPGLRANWNFDTGFPDFVFARPIRLFGVPQSDADYEAAARRFVDTYPSLFGFDSSVLVTEQVKHVDMSRAGTTDKVGVGFKQVVDGTSVLNGSVSFVFNYDGAIVGVENKALPNVDQIDVVPTLGEAQATQIAEQAFGRRSVVRSVEIAIVPNGRKSGGVLAWVVELNGGWDATKQLPVQEKFQVDAHDGTVIRRENTICTFTDLTGHLNQWATPGTLSDEPSNPIAKLTGAYYVHTTCPIGATDSNDTGDWTITYSGSSVQLVTFAFGSNSLWAWVINKAGSNYSLAGNATPGVPFNVGLNKTGATEQTTAQQNGQRSGNIARSYVKTLDPTETKVDFRQKINVDINATCNAYYDGSSTNFYKKGGGCYNTAYSTVVGHETGHWFNDKFSSGNGPDGFGEGAADTWAMYEYDTPIVGEDFFTSGGDIRTGLNTVQYCGKCAAGCYGEVHTDGQVLMGAFWKVRDNLNNSLGDAAGDSVADNLWLDWFQLYNASTICTSNETQILTIDDDNGNIDDGTPHSTDINNAFVTQGYPSYY